MYAIDADKAAVVLLSRPGPAREKLRMAIHNAGGVLVMESAPLEASADGVLGLSPAAVVLAMDDGDDQVLDELLPQLTDSGVLLLLEEADLAAAREGWDAQRWERHLSAKLQGHQNVLPPGHASVEPESAQSLSARPASSVEDGLQGLDVLPDTEAVADVGLSVLDFDDGAAVAIVPEADPAVDLPAVPAADGVIDAGGDLTLDFSSFDLGDDSLDWEPPAVAAVESVEGLDFVRPMEDSEYPAGMGRADAMDIALVQAESALALSSRKERGSSVESSQERTIAPPLPSRSVDVPPPAQWSLMSLDDEPVHAPAPARHEAPAALQEWNLDGLSLAPLEGEAPAVLDHAEVPAFAARQSGPKGVAVLMAGIGGPDAVRRLLSVLPAEGMGGALLVQLKLDGGRHENLALQLARACPAPLKLATVGETLQAGHVYVLDDQTSLQKDGDGWRFATLDADHALLAGVEAVSVGAAVVMLSGADAALVPAVLDLHARGVWVAGQAGEGCYDPAAASALAVAGLPVGEPAWLASGLLALWQ